jgi:hypothetical protein
MGSKLCLCRSRAWFVCRMGIWQSVRGCAPAHSLACLQHSPLTHWMLFGCACLCHALPTQVRSCNTDCGHSTTPVKHLCTVLDMLNNSAAIRLIHQANTHMCLSVDHRMTDVVSCPACMPTEVFYV